MPGLMADHYGFSARRPVPLSRVTFAARLSQRERLSDFALVGLDHAPSLVDLRRRAAAIPRERHPMRSR